jgi:hypothetical protein
MAPACLELAIAMLSTGEGRNDWNHDDRGQFGDIAFRDYDGKDHRGYRHDDRQTAIPPDDGEKPIATVHPRTPPSSSNRSADVPPNIRLIIRPVRDESEGKQAANGSVAPEKLGV